MKDLEKLVKQFGSVVVLENDKPSFVVLSFEKYQELAPSQKDNEDSNEQEAQEILVKHLPVQSNGHDVAKFVMQNFMQENKPESESEAVEKLNKEILVLKEEIRLREDQNI